MTEPTRHSFTAQRRQLSWLDWGNPDRPTLVLLHGRKDHARSWDWTADALRDEWRVVVPDMRGHGDSDWSPEGRYDFATHLYDFAEFLHRLGDAPVTIVAHSFGAHIALRYAGLYPNRVARLVAIEPRGAPLDVEAERTSPPPDAQTRRWIEEKRAAEARVARSYASVEEAEARLAAENPRLSEAQVRHLTRHGLRRAEDGGWRWKLDPLLHLWPHPDLPQEQVEAIWARVACPVLLLYGREGWPSSLPAALARTLPDARTVELDHAGHWPHHDSFERFLSQVSGFLS